MRFQKFLLFFLIVSLVLSLSFLQTVRAEADSSDALIRLLREKQTELDAGQNGVKTDKPASRPAPAAVAGNSSSSSSDVDLIEALRRKQAELDAKGGVQKPAQQVPAPAAIPTPKPEAIASQPAVSPAEESELLKLLREKQAELDGKSAAAAPAPQVAQPAPKAPASKPMKPAPAPAQPSVAAQPAMSPKTEKQLLELLEKKQAELDAKEGVPAVAKPAPAEAERIRQIEAEIKAKEEAFKKSAAKQKTPATTQAPKVVAQPKVNTPAATEPVAVPDTKEARLAELLRKYKADEITPHEYHLQRAKIIAEP